MKKTIIKGMLVGMIVGVLYSCNVKLIVQKGDYNKTNDIDAINTDIDSSTVGASLFSKGQKKQQ